MRDRNQRPDVEQLRQARQELADWQEQVIASVQAQTRLPAFSRTSHIAPAFRERLRRAVAACETAYEVRMTLCSVQDHQLV